MKVPTIWPSALMPVALVPALLGTFNVVKIPFAYWLWLTLSAETLFGRGRAILGPEGASEIVSSSLDFLSRVNKKSAGAVAYARSFVNTGGPLERVLPPPQDAASGSVVVAK
jgi:hypothetical protein